jgi:calcium-dependent protein kinase
MVLHLSTKDELDFMQKTFKAFDLDGNGVITKDELFQGYKRLYSDKLSEDDIKKELDVLWLSVDSDGSGQIDYTEWAVASANKESLLTDRRLKQAFCMFDEDASGFISAEEL